MSPRRLVVALVLELVINLKTAGALGLTLPRSLLLRADHVIQWDNRRDAAYDRL